MAADVGRTLQNIFEENAAMSPDESRQLIESMKVRERVRERERERERESE